MGMTGSPPPGFAPRTVRCPACGRPARYAPDNPWRPFCSARCKQVDLGAWASEAYRVPDPTPPTPGPETPPH
ncbi:DNA gyrase inhibitor YacG [Tepidimonas sediminis]|uniref:DNA gyrase inhibitor YacG n=2 Tax=Tepidimonas sediminis TaxID=2588941 RepID=A0A554WRK3_9BURK|nr:DNA gyrase inhibitor YacG [Tepidimonas sediminis]